MYCADGINMVDETSEELMARMALTDAKIVNTIAQLRRIQRRMMELAARKVAA